MIIKNNILVEDDWQVLRFNEQETAETVTVSEGKVIVPLKVWQAQRDRLLPRQQRGEIGVWFASDDRPKDLKQDVQNFPVIAVDFPVFSDGRGYSIAYNLRVRLGFSGELRAIGDVLRDQLFYMRRVGFDAFAPRPDRDIHEALKGLEDFSEVYQSSFDQKLPLFKRVHRKGKSANETVNGRSH
ncbi:Uncharacterized conserved protein, DUF934 family [Nitrosomonas sp. Nm51]|uniref:DUF934 domain-containing protein n=1 Tax=Nitrosomonas sp. Nm51 TaxID=133720 RepID=UPI0008C260E4|nr:DUF934 domain-containing protein [Nitrosomonas sp. Nm51]SEQ83853.1 Uncharacterized conserved protein, DUF934 family [Nitrosomonas sp. Nm51]